MLCDWGDDVIAQQANDKAGLYLLFASGNRPDRDSIRRFAERHPAVSLSHDPSDSPAPELVGASADADAATASPGTGLADKVWIELLRDGLTFDLRGMMPGRACPAPHAEHLFDLEEAPALSTCEGMRIVPGPHLAGGERTAPVIRGMIALARDLVHHFDSLVAVVWPPAKKRDRAALLRIDLHRLAGGRGLSRARPDRLSRGYRRRAAERRARALDRAGASHRAAPCPPIGRARRGSTCGSSTSWCWSAASPRASGSSLPTGRG